ncbi:MAG: TetR/AcrR family transcriptional regulator [Acidimicrobiia bacterium]|nr:TetR/AcrR family transcriptional regulator [Acidimicrobiia bacterium]
MTAAAGEVATRPAGRPRSPEVDEAISDAVIDELAEHGWDGLTVEGVAARAGVGKATIYRRHPSKIDLLIAAAERLVEQSELPPDTGSLDGDVRALGRSYVRMMTRSRLGPLVPATIAATVRSPELARVQRRFMAQQLTGLSQVIARAVDRGELTRDADVDLFVEMLLGTLFYRIFVSKRPVDDRAVDALADRLLTAFT